jgi:hypothetical protein
MRLFSAELFRNFSIGFVSGGLLIAGANAENWSADLSAAARAEPLPQRVQPAPEFVIPADEHP